MPGENEMGVQSVSSTARHAEYLVGEFTRRHPGARRARHRPYPQPPAEDPHPRAEVIFEQPCCSIGNLVVKGIAQRQAAFRYLHDLAALDVLREMPFGKEKLFIHPKLMQLLSRDNNQFQPYT